MSCTCNPLRSSPEQSSALLSRATTRQPDDASSNNQSSTWCRNKIFAEHYESMLNSFLAMDQNSPNTRDIPAVDTFNMIGTKHCRAMIDMSTCKHMLAAAANALRGSSRSCLSGAILCL